MSKDLSGIRLQDGTVPKSALAPEVLAEIAGGLTAAQVDAKINELKLLLFGGQVPAALDTFIELAAALDADRSGLNALQTVVSGKASPADITTAVNAAVTLLLGGASDDSNTLKKLEVMVKAAQQAAVNAIADNVVTNLKLGPDVKVGSLNAAANAFPTAVQSGLTSVEKFLVYLAQQLSAVQASGGQQAGTASNHEQRLVSIEQALPNKASATDVNNLSQRVATTETGLTSKASAAEVSGLTSRVAALEARPTGGTGGTTLTDGSVNNSHLATDIKAGSLENANTTLQTTAVSITGLIVQVYNKLKAQIDNLAVFPSQSGNAGKALLTNGTSVYWGVVSSSGETPTVTGEPVAVEGTQTAAMLDFGKEFQVSDFGSGSRTISDFRNVRLGGRVRLKVLSTNANDTFAIGTGSGATRTANISTVGTQGTSQSITIVDRGYVFVGGVTNTLYLQCVSVAPYTFEYINLPLE